MDFSAIVGGDHCYSGALGIDAQRCINWFVERTGNPGAKGGAVLRPVPGYDLFASFAPKYPGKVRGMYFTSRGIGSRADGMLVVVASESVYWLKQDGSQQLLGSISNGPYPVGIVDDGFGMVVVDGSTMWRLEFASGKWSGMGTEAPIQCRKAVALNQYTVTVGTRNGEPSNYWYYSEPFKNGTWPALNYYQATTSADPVTALGVLGAQLWLLGPRSFEVWTISGNSKKPFTRLAGAAGSVGILAPDSLGKMNDQLFFLGGGDNGTAIAYITNGYRCDRISTHPLEQEWAEFGTKDDAVGFCYAQGGHMFWVLTFPMANRTYCYDLTTGVWHQRATRDPMTDAMGKWNPLFCVSAYGKVFVGSQDSTEVFELSPQYTTENGKAIVRIRTCPHINNKMERMIHSALTLDVLTGVGVPSGQGSDPQMMLRVSRDGGYTYGSEMWAPVGRQGEYKRLVQWRRLGQARDCVYEIVYSDPANTAIMGAQISGLPSVGRS